MMGDGIRADVASALVLALGNVEQTLVLSTAHLPHFDAMALDRAAKFPNQYASRGWPVPSMAREQGWLLHVGTPDDLGEAPESSAIQEVARYARRRGCVWVLFDCDAAKIPELPTWEW